MTAPDGRPLRRLVAATRNPGKLVELRAALAGFELLSLADFPGAPEVAETGATYAENAALKAVSALRSTGLAAIGDDTGLEVDALDGRPGLRSAVFAGPERDGAANCARLLEALAAVPEAGRTARFRCVLALAEPGGNITSYEGVVEGVIAHSPRGDRGFGYDPIFVIAGLGRTMAELSAEEKNCYSHRGRAAAALATALRARED